MWPLGERPLGTLGAAPVRRGLLQAEGSLSTLPNWFGGESCSEYGSRSTEWLVGAPRWRFGLQSFEPEAEGGEFYPASSTYLEPLIVIAMFGLLMWTLLGLGAVTFFVLRYRYGLAGEPFPTTKAYPRHEVAQAMGATVVCVLLLCAFAAFAVLAFNASADGAYDAALAGTVGWEDVLHAGFALGHEVLDGSLAELDSIDAFNAAVGATYNAARLSADLACLDNMLRALPAAAPML